VSFGFNADEVFRIAIKIEENGKDFYEKAQERIDDPEVREIFADLAGQEVEHKQRFQKMREELPGHDAEPTVFDPENELNLYLQMVADQHIFRRSEGVDEHVAGIDTAEEALRMAVQFEKDSVIFFLTMQEATEEEKGREKIGLLVKEEQEHLRRLSMQLRKRGASS
jgi:rubrerythrin